MPEAHRWNASYERYLSALVLAIAILIFTLVELRISSPNRDNTWLLEIARRMMGGGKYYVDFFELNPPLYPVLLMPVEFLSARNGLSQFIYFNAFIAFLVYMSCYANYFLISRVFGINFSSHISLSIALAAILFFAPGSEFGQRDHVAIVLILPSLTWFAVRNDDRRLTPFSIALVTCAALGFMIKPYLLGVGIAVYALRIITDRTIRVLIDPPILIVAVSSIIYVICIWYMFPEYFVVMRLAGQYYSAYNTDHVFDNLSIGGAAAILVISIFNECIHESPATLRFSRVLSAAACGAVFSYVIQRKGFPYHFIPAKVVILLLFAVAIVSACRLVRAWAGGLLFRRRCVLAALAICVALLRVVGSTALAAHGQDVVMGQFAQSLTNLNAGKRLFFFATGLFPEYPMNLYYNTDQASRFASIWPLPALVKREQRGNGRMGELNQEEKQLRDLVAEDLRRWRPDTILVDESPRKEAIDGDFDYLAWFERDPTLADMLKRYRRVGQLSEPFDIWKFGVYTAASPPGR